MKIYLRKRNIKICLCILLILFIFVMLIKSYKQGEELSEDTLRFKETELTNFAEESNDNLNVLDDNYVDNFASLLMNQRERVHNSSRGMCKERRSFVFIKTMKCGTQTLVNMFRRFVYLRNLNFMLPRGTNIYLGWPFILEKQDYRPSKKPFQGLLDHAIYNRTVMRKLIKNDAAYITIIREPFSHFKSSFNYFNVANITFVKETDQVSGYLRNLDKYETFYKSHEGSKIRYCIPDGFSVTKNLLSNCLGMPLGFPEGRNNIEADDVAVKDYIRQLDEDFALVMLMEYFHESLILLKRIMCWSFDDLLYNTINVGSYKFKKSPAKEETVKIYRDWSHIDYLLYDHFNRTFWRKVGEQGTDFHEEVKEFSKVQSQVTVFCDPENTDSSFVIEKSKFTDRFDVSKDFCIMLKIDLSSYLTSRFDRINGWKETEEYTKQFPKRAC